MSDSPNHDALRSLEAFDQELRRHIGRLLEIECSDGRVADLLYDAIQAAARTGQICRAAQRELRVTDAPTP